MLAPPASPIVVLPQLEQFDWLEHGFGTRHAKWNVDTLSTVRQIHSARVVTATGETGCLGEGDALTSDIPGILLAIKTADCFPVLLVDPVHRAVAAVHAGWRGAAQKITDAVIRKMRERFHSDPADLHAAIGPGIQKCCFEVGPEVARGFAGYDSSMAEINHRTHLELDAIVQRQLGAAGLRPDRIYSTGLCTVCNPAQFYSWRRDREAAGRMLSVIGVRQKGGRLEVQPAGRS